jgi:hypothetical protein
MSSEKFCAAQLAYLEALAAEFLSLQEYNRHKAHHYLEMATYRAFPAQSPEERETYHKKCLAYIARIEAHIAMQQKTAEAKAAYEVAKTEYDAAHPSEPNAPGAVDSQPLAPLVQQVCFHFAAHSTPDQQAEVYAVSDWEHVAAVDYGRQQKVIVHVKDGCDPLQVLAELEKLPAVSHPYIPQQREYFG